MFFKILLILIFLVVGIIIFSKRRKSNLMKLIKIENLKFNIETVQFDIVNPTNTDFLFVEFEILLFDNDNIIAKKIEGCSYELNPNKTVQVSMSLGKTKKKFSHFEVYLKDIIY